MSFLKGSVTCQRFAVDGGILSEADVDLSAVVAKLPARSFTRPLSLDGDEYPHYGWCGGADIKDADFAEEKVLRGPFVCFGMLVVKQAVPQPEVAARAREELESLALGRPPRPQDRRNAARVALEAMKEESRRTGRWLKSSVVPVVYDSERRHLWLGSSSHAVVGGFQALVQATFDGQATAMDPKYHLPEPPAGDVPDWLGDDEAANAWGNRFAAEVVRRAADVTVPVDRSFVWPSGAEAVTLVPRRTLTMRCPLGLKGLDRFDHETPYAVPELAEAMREGKVPTAMGLDLSWRSDDEPIPFSLVPHRLTVSGARIPKGEAKNRAEAELDRLTLTRSFLDAVDGAVLSYAKSQLV